MHAIAVPIAPGGTWRMRSGADVEAVSCYFSSARTCLPQQDGVVGMTVQPPYLV